MKKSVALFISALLFGAVACGDDDSNGGVPAGACDPAGTYTSTAKLVLAGNTKVCQDLAAVINAEASEGGKSTITKNADGTFSLTDPDDPTATPQTASLDGAACALSFPAETQQLQIQDEEGKTVTVTLSGSTRATFNGKTGTSTAVAQLVTEDATAKGIPCTISGSVTGTKP